MSAGEIALGEMTLGVIVPCRNEELVITRKLENLARCRWPESTRGHVLALVDDGSDDGTRAAALAAAQRLEERLRERGVRVELLENDVRPGKTGAIEQGLRALAGRADVIVLTDADVVLGEEALIELVNPLTSDARVAMSCGAQRVVESLASDGSLRSAEGSALRSRATVYDRLTALARRAESAFGAVFSVHGQLMAWRAELNLRPTRGMAADDLDLMLQARCRGLRVAFAPRALFFEVRPSSVQARRLQAGRRARAFLQFLEHPRRPEFSAAGPLAWRLQAALYLGLRELCVVVLLLCFAAYVASWIGDWRADVAWTVRLASIAISLPLALAVRGTLGRAREAGEGGRPTKDRWETVRK